MRIGRHVVIAALCFPAWLAADNWPQWRGPDAGGVAVPG